MILLLLIAATPAFGVAPWTPHLPTPDPHLSPGPHRPPEPSLFYFQSLSAHEPSPRSRNYRTLSWSQLNCFLKINFIFFIFIEKCLRNLTELNLFMFI